MTQREKDLKLALDSWTTFLTNYSRVEPGSALDLRGDPPQFVLDLIQQIRNEW